MSFADLIALKRDGREHSQADIEAIVGGFTAGDVPDYQMSAWLMAAYLRGLSDSETVWLTHAMACSGEMLDLSAIPGVKLDKHSTGGVADTTTLVVAPLVAACGVPVAKMSGRGLGHTGGTLDKLEAIPGFRVDLSVDEFVAQVRDIGIAVVAQSPAVDPADKLIYALRDVTATVESIPLIVASILSKKIAGGADAILLDVKCGSGAFMKSPKEARELAEALRRTGEALGRPVECVLTDMSQPLGASVGNALEVAEAIRTLSGGGHARLTELCLSLAAKMLVLGERASDETEARRIAEVALADGSALEKFAEWVAAQGGEPRIVADPSLLPAAPYRREARASSAGFVSGVDAELLGTAAMAAGAGREFKEQAVDPSAGIELAVEVGDEVREGDLVAVLHSSDESRLDVPERLVRSAIRVSAERVTAPPLFLGE